MTPSTRFGCLAALCLISLSTTGCLRPLFRELADRDAYCLVRTKTNDPRWPLEGYTIEIDPASRMYDPFNPDFPPMPPDDPAAHRYMHCVDHKHGWPFWHANGDTPHVANPHWLSMLPLDERGKLKLDVDSSVQLALLQAPDYQRELETLFLSALDVSFERFRFDTQFFAGTRAVYAADGSNRSGTGDQSSRFELATFSREGDVRARRMFATGAELVVGLANSIVWEFSGSDSQLATSLLDLTFVQPLLRRGGRNFVLERLTISERALLANVRQLERFRRGFYVSVVTGRNPGAGPTRRGGVFGGAGLEGFSGVGGGGFGQIAGGGAFGGGAGGVTGGAGAGQAGGYLGLLQQQQDIRNQRANIAALKSSVAQLEAFFYTGRIDFFQVELARQALFNGQSRLLNAEQQYRNDLDDYKIQLGLPPGIELQLDDDLIKPFQLIDPTIVDVQNQVTRLQQRVGRILVEILEAQADEFDNPARPDEPDQGPLPPPGQAEEGPDLLPPALKPAANAEDEALGAETLLSQLQSLRKDLQRAMRLCEQTVKSHVPIASRDIETLRGAVDRRVKTADRLRGELRQRRSEFSDVTGQGKMLDNNELARTADALDNEEDDLLPVIEDVLKVLPDELSKALESVKVDFAQLHQRFEKLDAEIASVLEGDSDLTPAELQTRFREKIATPLPEQLNDLSTNVLSLTLIEARARTESVELVPIDLDWTIALEAARSNRRDWMNARASLVDSWRLIQFNADALESQVDIVFDGEIGRLPRVGGGFRGDNGRLRVGVEFDAPISRLAERNVYRQSLIEYQQARRSFYQFRDGVSRGLRQIIRAIDVNQLNFEFRRAAVEVAIAQVELTQLRLQEPPKPDEEATFGATTARDLVSALSDLLNVQNDFLSVWIVHESLRRSLDFDMGTMELDPRGVWIDPGAIEAGDYCERLDSGEFDDVELLPPGARSSDSSDQEDAPAQPINQGQELPEPITESDADSSRPVGLPPIQDRQVTPTGYWGNVDRRRDPPDHSSLLHRLRSPE